jgi:all-trans-8'-apo-beta-carotenal 15,15'-oxygenase
MVIAPNRTQVQQGAWTGAVLNNGVEFPPTSLSVLSGQLPKGLRGSLYRNGPAHFERSGERVKHWFDGDGAILAVHFDESEATGVYRYVQTQGYQEELAAEQLLYGGFGTLPKGLFHQKLGRRVKHVANTSLLAVSDQLLALWEVGCPYRLDPRSLETEGMTKLGLWTQFPYSAHPKRDPRTGEIFNFGLSYWVTHATVNLYRSDASGQIVKRRQYRMPKIRYIHDIALVGPYLVLVVPPVQIQTFPHLTLFQKSVSECATWLDNEATEILIFDRSTLNCVSRIQAEPWFHWHFGNGYEVADGSLVLSVIRYDDFQTNYFFRELVAGQIETPFTNRGLWQLRLDVKAQQVIDFSPLWERACEMPVVSPQEVGYENRRTAMICYGQSAGLGEWFHLIAQYDHRRDRFVEADFGASLYPSEPIYARDVENPDREWLLTVVYDGNAHQSEVWIFDANRLDADPVCRLGLPEVIPLSFHGTWRSASSSEYSA